MTHILNDPPRTLLVSQHEYQILLKSLEWYTSTLMKVLKAIEQVPLADSHSSTDLLCSLTLGQRAKSYLFTLRPHMKPNRQIPTLDDCALCLTVFDMGVRLPQALALEEEPAVTNPLGSTATLNLKLRPTAAPSATPLLTARPCPKSWKVYATLRLRHPRFTRCPARL